MFVGAAGLFRLVEDDIAHKKARSLRGHGSRSGSNSDDEQKDWLSGRVLALSRWEWQWPQQAAGGGGAPSQVHHGANPMPTATSPAGHQVPWSPVFAHGSQGSLLPRPDSQDAWLFQSPLPPRAAQAVADAGSSFWLGMPRCDNRLAEVRRMSKHSKARTVKSVLL